MQSFTNKNKRHKILLFLNTQDIIVFFTFFLKIYMDWVGDLWFWKGPNYKVRGLKSKFLIFFTEN